MRPRRLRSADAETGRTIRVAESSCQEGARGSCREAEAQECSSRCSTSRQSTASVVHWEQQLRRLLLGRRTSGRLAANGCSCSRCSGRRSRSRATSRAETQGILLSRRMSTAPCPYRLLVALCTHAPLRVAVPTTALLPLRRSQRPRPSGSRPLRCLCSAHPGRTCTCTPPQRVAHARSIDSIAASGRLLSAARRRGVR